MDHPTFRRQLLSLVAVVFCCLLSVSHADSEDDNAGSFQLNTSNLKKISKILRGATDQADQVGNQRRKKVENNLLPKDVLGADNADVAQQLADDTPPDEQDSIASSIDYNWGDNTVSRADVLREYGDDINNATLDVIVAHDGNDATLLHLNASDYVASCSYDDAQTMAFSITGHLVVEDPRTIQITCPSCAEEGCDGAICTLEVLGDEADQLHLRGVALSDEQSNHCFSLESTVFVKDKGVISIKDLRIGDMVLSNDQGSYTKYYSIGHYLEQAQAEFLRIYTEAQFKPIELTPKHMIFRETDALPVPAHSIKVGDVVKTIDGPSKVTDIRKITRKGMFSPYTFSSTIVVDGIVSSNHVTLPGFEGTDAGWLYLADHKFIHWHTLVHVALAPHRIICGRFMLCTDTLNEEGYDHYAQYLMSVADVAKEKQSTILRFCLILFVVAQSASFFLLEILIQHAIVFVSATCVFLIGRKWLFSKSCNKAKAL